MTRQVGELVSVPVVGAPPRKGMVERVLDKDWHHRGALYLVRFPSGKTSRLTDSELTDREKS
jgi:hypothetical protein